MHPRWEEDLHEQAQGGLMPAVFSSFSWGGDFESPPYQAFTAASLYPGDVETWRGPWSCW